MKSLLVFITFSCLSLNAFADFAQSCQAEVERQEPQLASESSATLENKQEISKSLINSELTEKDIADLLDLLKTPDTAVFSFSNDAGVWISIVKASTCRVIVTQQIYSI